MALIIVTLSRIGLGFWQIECVSAVDGWSHLLLQGLRVDLATLCWLWGIAALGTAIFSGDHVLPRLEPDITHLADARALADSILGSLICCVYPGIWHSAKSSLYRIPHLSQRGVFHALGGGRKLEVIFGFLISGATLLGGWKLSGYLLRDLTYSRWYWRPVIAVAVIVLTLLGARSSLGHRPLNPALVAFTDDPLVNSLVVNSAYSLFFAINQMGNEANAAKIYGRMDEQKIIDTIRRESGRDLSAFPLAAAPSVSFNPASYQGKPKNLLIILQESLGARFLGNGFSNIVDEDDYDNPSFVASWGVSDEDLLRRADQEFRKFHKQGKPFFSLVFSSSNHEPFEFPDGKIELYEQPKQTVNNAVKYADYALGEFFKLAKQSDYWKDTLFLIVADHDSRVGGASLVPISRFRIPGIILGDGIEPKKDQRVVSQIDMAPTLLSLIGISDSYPMLGQDLTRVRDDWPGRALMQYNQNMAYMRGNDVVVLQPERAAAGFEYDFDTETLSAKPQSDEMKQAALSWALWGSMAYQKGLYRSASPQERLAFKQDKYDAKQQLALEYEKNNMTSQASEVLLR
ncbi:protein of unknown function [Shewanella benthica]|uniref:Sulfatase N-terminal domain-containing protein n=1 Tax=Shewanella benthica TaxID=43661 RepID=A0A330M4T5_9GAMM|nr:protein of unknown function [Shewanella benthica]